MADLDVHPKRSRTWWPWLLLIVFVLVLLVYFARGGEDDRFPAPDAGAATTGSAAVP